MYCNCCIVCVVVYFLFVICLCILAVLITIVVLHLYNRADSSPFVPMPPWVSHLFLNVLAMHQEAAIAPVWPVR